MRHGLGSVASAPVWGYCWRAGTEPDSDSFLTETAWLLLSGLEAAVSDIDQTQVIQ
jgi:hypothetical protein